MEHASPPAAPLPNFLQLQSLLRGKEVGLVDMVPRSAFDGSGSRATFGTFYFLKLFVTSFKGSSGDNIEEVLTRLTLVSHVRLWLKI